MKGLYLLICLALWSCGPGYHLKRAKLHLMKAEAKGADIKQDTVFKEIVLKVPGVKVEFTPKPLVLNDTLYFERDRVVTKVLVKNIPGKDNTVYVKTDCPDKVIETKVPVSVNKTITAKKGIGWHTVFMWVAVALAVGFIIGRLWPIIRRLVVGV